jgi:hypothetical protein
MTITRAQVAKIGQGLVAIGGFLGVLWFGSFIFLISAFLHAPLHPDSANGYTALWINHGDRHYVNRSELDLFNAMLLYAPFYLFFMATALWMYKGPRAILGGR